MSKLVVLAIGGNSLIKDEQHQTVEDQYQAICETVEHIVDIIEDGYEVIVTHGNGPQVGFILRRSEIAQEKENMHPVPLVNCGADTQGSIGYQIQQALDNEFQKRGITKKAVTIITQVEVEKDDPSFLNPTKPIGRFYTEGEVNKLKKQYPGCIFVNDAGRGYRRVVASPVPKKIVEKEIIELLVKNGYCVIAVGGGGIPVIRDNQGKLKGIDAVIDKDYASSLLATELKADLFVISTAVEKVCMNYGKPNEKPLERLTITEARKLIEEGHFSPGSMLPKIKAVLNFLEHRGKQGIITSPEHLRMAFKGRAGTHIFSDLVSSST
ncbi:MAG TPA: carbamate kinase [Syntrophomonadaceae bacterium]|nr:carbamate kinase [Syntrophomonadaceae bacterium]